MLRPVAFTLLLLAPWAPRALAIRALPDAVVRCSRGYAFQGSVVGNAVDGCTGYFEAGTAVPDIEIFDGRAETTLLGREYQAKLEFRVVGNGVLGIIKARPSTRENFAAVGRGMMVPGADSGVGLSLFLGDRTFPDRPGCLFAQYVNVSCALQR